MIINIYFTKQNNNQKEIIIPFKNQKELNSFMYRTLGDNNIYHDRFSDYSISSIQVGNKLNNNF